MMIDNKKVNENHQQGIERVKQRKGDMEVGKGGKMGKVVEAEWARSGNKLTPRKA